MLGAQKEELTGSKFLNASHGANMQRTLSKHATSVDSCLPACRSSLRSALYSAWVRSRCGSLLRLHSDAADRELPGPARPTVKPTVRSGGGPRSPCLPGNAACVPCGVWPSGCTSRFVQTSILASKLKTAQRRTCLAAGANCTHTTLGWLDLEGATTISSYVQ